MLRPCGREEDGYRAETTGRKRFQEPFSFQGWKEDHDNFEQQFERVVKALRTDREPAPKPQL